MSFQTKKSEFDHFSGLANDRWSKNGKFKILHDIQSVRMQYIRKTLNKKNFNKTKILDVGCGGGLISQALSKLGANVTGIDFVEENIKISRLNAKKDNLKINYIVKDFENEEIQSKFDLIIIFEVLEHLNNWEDFLKKIRINLNQNGSLIISTINRNLLSKFATLDIAENFIKWIPLNTHSYYKYIKPIELEFFLKKNNFKNIKFTGLKYNFFKTEWELSKSTKINYFCSSIIN